jgi:hypothetical protein
VSAGVEGLPQCGMPRMARLISFAAWTPPHVRDSTPSKAHMIMTANAPEGALHCGLGREHQLAAAVCDVGHCLFGSLGASINQSQTWAFLTFESCREVGFLSTARSRQDMAATDR